jgi:hypothetical protein
MHPRRDIHGNVLRPWEGIDTTEIPWAGRDEMQPNGANAASAGRSEILCHAGFGLERIECIASGMSTEMSSGCAGADVTEIPQVDDTKTQSNSAGAILA